VLAGESAWRRRAVDNHLGLVQPELVCHVDGKRGCVGALDVEVAHVGPLLGNEALNQLGGHLLDVLGQILGLPARVSNLDGGVCGWAKMDQGSANGSPELGNNLGSRASVDVLGRVALLLHARGLGSPLSVHLSALRHQHNGDGSLDGALEEGLPKRLREAVDNAIVGKEDLVVGKELALGLVRLELCLDVCDVDNAGDALAQVLGELLRRDHVLVRSLRVGCDQADGGLLVGVQGVREDDLVGLETVRVVDVRLGGQGEPHWRLCNDCLFIGEQVLLARRWGGSGLLDVGDERFGGFQGLKQLLDNAATPIHRQ